MRLLLQNVVDFSSALEGCGGATNHGETADGTQSDYYKLDVDARDQQGRTALHVASQLGQSEYEESLDQARQGDTEAVGRRD